MDFAPRVFDFAVVHWINGLASDGSFSLKKSDLILD